MERKRHDLDLTGARRRASSISGIIAVSRSPAAIGGGARPASGFCVRPVQAAGRGIDSGLGVRSGAAARGKGHRLNVYSDRVGTVICRGRVGAIDYESRVGAVVLRKPRQRGGGREKR